MAAVTVCPAPFPLVEERWMTIVPPELTVKVLPTVRLEVESWAVLNVPALVVKVVVVVKDTLLPRVIVPV